MGDKTGIEWTDATWNPVTGCDRVSPGCDNCYALTMAARLKRMGSANYQTDGDPHTSGPGFGMQCHPEMLEQPLRWKRPRRIFVNSMSDMFHKDMPLSFINDVWDVMARCPQHTFQILTKRSRRMRQLLAGSQHGMALVPWVGGFTPLPNVWLGVSIENDRYTFRADDLRKTPAAVRFISAEPLLGPLPSLDLTNIDWAIVGGESGPGARPMHPDWVRDIRDRCEAASVPFHFKQWGAWQIGSAPSWNHASLTGRVLLDDGQVFPWYDPELRKAITAAGLTADEFQRRSPTVVSLVGKKNAGRILDGRTWDEFPQAVSA